MSYAIQFAQTGEADVLQKVSVDPKDPGADQIRIRHSAIGLNFVDVYHRQGIYPLPLPAVPGVEGAGVVEAVGERVTNVKVGDRVAYAGVVGAYAETRLLPAWRAVKLPDSLDFDLAGGTLLRGLTAFMLLHKVYPVSAGMVILVHAAAGGLGTILVRWAKSLGAEVIGTASSLEKAQLASQAGADHVIVGRDVDLAVEVGKSTDGQGVHLAIDGIGGATLAKTIASVRPFGMTANIGQVAGAPPAVPLSALRSNAFSRPSVMAFAASEAAYRPAVMSVFEKMEAGVLDMPSRTYELTDAVAAHRDLEAGVITGAAVFRL
ncbi:quinone oxidoreductase [Rhizobium lemnae]|uniref:Quinone oxidoreductase family protein n=1 Tax=Rhizobium lemnae TaxID=1214924 RepID=A0ABV8E957_9HYPH|nr:quinone oxidoreductase [Rhizobium lemnae]MCJ8508434.1 quinone oxidoreductase [Rhizobium lemnae]